jgi:hypothetical protein
MVVRIKQLTFHDAKMMWTVGLDSKKSPTSLSSIGYTTCFVGYKVAVDGSTPSG